MDAAFGVLMSGVLQAGLLHNADVFSLLANNQVANPLVESGDPALANGSLGLLSLVAQVLAQHVNKYPHKNPHGLAASDIGALTIAGAAYSLGPNGYLQLPTWLGGIIVQWGYVSGTSGASGSPIVFNPRFPNAVFGVWPIPTNTSNANYNYTNNVSQAGFNLANDGNGAAAYWFAIGY
jgi:hypothetical protein